MTSTRLRLGTHPRSVQKMLRSHHRAHPDNILPHTSDERGKGSPLVLSECKTTLCCSIFISQDSANELVNFASWNERRRRPNSREEGCMLSVRSRLEASRVVQRTCRRRIRHRRRIDEHDISAAATGTVVRRRRRRLQIVSPERTRRRLADLFSITRPPSSDSPPHNW